MNVLYFQQKLAGGTRAFIRLGGPLRLEESLDLLAVRGRSGLSVIGGHRGDSGKMCSHRIRFYPGPVNGDGECVWKRGDREMGFN